MAARGRASGRAARSGAKKTTRRRPIQRPKSPRSNRVPGAIGCPIVGVGGSAGGFEAAMDLLQHLPAKSEMAFAIVQHLDPHHASKLASLLGRATQMPVVEVTKTTRPEPNRVYVQPPNKCMVLK